MRLGIGLQIIEYIFEDPIPPVADRTVFEFLLKVLVLREQHKALSVRIRSSSWLEALINGGDIEYRCHFRLSKSTVAFIYQNLFPQEITKIRGRPGMEKMIWLHIFLKRMACRSNVTDLARMFGVARGMVVKASEVVSRKLYETFSYLIRYTTLSYNCVV